MVDAEVRHHREVGVARRSVVILERDMDRGRVVLEEGGPGAFAHRVPGAGEDPLDAVPALVGGSVTDVHGGVVGEQGEEFVEPAPVAEGVVGGHERGDLDPCLDLPCVHPVLSGVAIRADHTTSVPQHGST